jgi:hypothetical protein
LFRSDDRGKTFEVVPSTLSHVGCLSPHEGLLTACAHQDLRFGLFRGAPGQAAFELELGFSDVTEVTCDEASDIVALCRANFLDWVRENPPTAGGVAGASGTSNNPVRSETGQPSCALRGPGSGAPSVLAVALLCCWSRLRRAGPQRKPGPTSPC